MPPNFTVPGMTRDDAVKVIDHLQGRLVTLIDLQLTLKHIHWNVVGPAFIGVHEMLDPQVDAVRAMVDETAERIATLGGEPNGLPGNLVRRAVVGRLRPRPGHDAGAPRCPRHGLRRGRRRSPAADRGARGARPGDPGHGDRAVRAAGAVPVVRTGAPREQRWPARDHRSHHRAPGRSQGRWAHVDGARPAKKAGATKATKSTGNGRRAASG